MSPSMIERITERASDHDVAVSVLHHVFRAEDVLSPGGIGRRQLLDIMERESGTRDLQCFVQVIDDTIDMFPYDQTDAQLYDVARCFYRRNCTIGHIMSLCTIPYERTEKLLDHAASRLQTAFKREGMWHKES